MLVHGKTFRKSTCSPIEVCDRRIFDQPIFKFIKIKVINCTDTKHAPCFFALEGQGEKTRKKHAFRYHLKFILFCYLPNNASM